MICMILIGEELVLLIMLKMLGHVFYDGFTDLVNKNAPLKRHRLKGRNNVLFSNDLSDLLLERNQAWAQARKSKLESDWLKFRRLRNLCTVKIRNAKSAYFLSETSKN